jgi:excinuclease ABC subunit A
MEMPTKYEPIVLKKVFVHNLKGVDLTLQPRQLIVFTGVSGSGKSSLAFDTIYAEGQRRYIESLPHSAKRFLGGLPKPRVESVSGMAPTIAIAQGFAGKTPRSTIGTITGIYDYLRVLFARVATPYCPVSQEPVSVQSQEKILASLQKIATGTKIFILSPYAKGKKGSFTEDFAEFMSKGFTRLRIDGQIVALTGEERLDEQKAHDIDIVIDRLTISKESWPRLAESAIQALELGKGFFSAYDPQADEETFFSQLAYSKKSGLSYEPLEPSDFSFNHPAGMCPRCHGLGVVQEFNLQQVINPDLSISEDCCSIASSYQTVRYGNIYRSLARQHQFDATAPWKELSAQAQHIFLYGTEQKWTKVTFTHPEKKTRWTEFVRWRGVLHEAHERLIAAKSELYRKKMAEQMIESVCPACQGARIKPYPAAARLDGQTIAQITRLTLEESLQFFERLRLSEQDQMIAEDLVREIRQRLLFLIRVGVQYLSLDRTAPSLSGGESQRVRLASHIGAGLMGAIYVLDEPSIGLHPADHHKLIDTLLALRNLGNTVIVVEHDLDTMLAADTIVDVGPGAGECGGRILAQGSVDDIARSPASLTGAYLSGRKTIPVPAKRRKKGKDRLQIMGASHHNLKNIDVSIPLNLFVCVTGVSGSGKSSLISDILSPALANHLCQARMPVGAHRSIGGIQHLDKVITIDQSPIGRTPRSNPATYVKLLDDIRDLFADLPQSRLRGFTASHFSFNVQEGSCSYCHGAGIVPIDMDFMEEAEIQCPQCRGQRYDPAILSISFKEKNIHDVLELSVDHALQLFESIPSLRKKLHVLQKIGLGYLRLGQPSTTLSGGEAQRIKLAKELIRPCTTKTLYILDEPTTGLHFDDIQRLIDVLQELVDKGSTVVVIEHNVDLIKCADWIIDLGPQAGVHGGELIGQGTPEQAAKLSTPTAAALKRGLHPAAYPPKPQIPLRQSHPFIEIKNAAQNNLKHISLAIEQGKTTVLTGPSGSGKSSLAFETLYAEGQRRYAETLSGYARQAIEQMPKPKVDGITGLPPVIALEQKTGGLNPRSTIGTITEIYDYLRVLYANLGVAYCPESGLKITQISKETVVERVLALPLQEKIQILAPLPLPRKESFQEMADRLNSDGFLRIRLNGTVYSLDEEVPYDPQRKNDLCLIVDRLTVNPASKSRLYESVSKAASRSNGIVVIARETQEMEDLYFNLSFAVEKTGKSYAPVTAQTFSFNAQSGMCPECQGLGAIYGAQIDSDRSIMRKSLLSLLKKLFDRKSTAGALQSVEKILQAAHIDPLQPLHLLPKEQISFIVNGSADIWIKTKSGLKLRWIGLHPAIERLARFARPEIRHILTGRLASHTCPSCAGDRLNPLARHVRIGAMSLPQLCALSIRKALDFIQTITPPEEKASLLKETFSQLKKSLSFLITIGLDYLSLDRAAPTLSGGELQRIRLARQLGSGLTSCLYILDEPTIGLHPHNSSQLLKALDQLRNLGNTLVLIEHDPMVVRTADYLFDFGPKAGKEGGYITARGTLAEILSNPQSLTGAYLSGRKAIPIPCKRRPFSPDIRIENASLHNLKQIDIAFARGAITCLTGVSGSGKSTLMHHLIRPAAELALQSKRQPDPIELHGARLFGLRAFEKALAIDQSPIGQTARADVSSYTEIQPLLRAHFASLPSARAKGLLGRCFSPNHIRGMCRTCWGLGYKTVDLQFLPAVRIPCDACHGHRLNPVSLGIFYKEKQFGQVLEMTVSEALVFFNAIPKIARRLQTVIDVGLGYLQLGQEVASLSGGEAQRLRLSRELAKRETGNTLYLIDEPTTGLHSEDIAQLLTIFHRLADRKNTLLLIEHNLDVIMNADYLINLGPGAGDDGGRVVAQGTPEQVASTLYIF